MKNLGPISNELDCVLFVSDDGESIDLVDVGVNYKKITTYRMFKQ